MEATLANQPSEVFYDAAYDFHDEPHDLFDTATSMTTPSVGVDVIQKTLYQGDEGLTRPQFGSVAGDMSPGSNDRADTATLTDSVGLHDHAEAIQPDHELETSQVPSPNDLGDEIAGGTHQTIAEQQATAAAQGHTGYCCGSPGASTPPYNPGELSSTPGKRSSDDSDLVSEEHIPKRFKKTPSSSATTAIASPDGSSAAEIEIDIPKPIEEHLRLHHKALKFKEDQKLPPNRYWIGVLKPDMQPKNVRTDKDVVWLKGHGGNTVKTIQNSYGQYVGLLADHFELMIRGQTPKPTDIMRELDYNNDCHVVFRAISNVIQID